MRTRQECQAFLTPRFAVLPLAVYILPTRAHPVCRYVNTCKAQSSFACADRSRHRRVCTVVSCVIFERGRAQEPTQQPAQRPRRVNGTDQTTDPKKNVSAGDEVDEGDVVRVETQLVSVPAVVTDSSGRPLVRSSSGKLPDHRRWSAANHRQLRYRRDSIRDRIAARHFGIDA